MPRLIDDIRAHGRLTAPWFTTDRKAWEQCAGVCAGTLMDPRMDLPVLLIDNVAAYYYQGSDQEYWNIAKDFPNLAPPYPVFWVEHRMPLTIHSKDKGDTDVSSMINHGRVGLLVRALTLDEVKAQDIPPGTRWILWLEIFIDYGWRNHPIDGPHGSICMPIDEHGALLAPPSMYTVTRGEQPEMMRDIITWCHPALLAITFLHCKNVTVEDNTVDKPLAKKYAARHNGVQPVKYKTLIIEPLKQVLRTQGRSGEVGIAKAMHICRGHFRDYREGRGLFGKYHALVWTPMTIRGTGSKNVPPREMEIKI